MTTNTQTHPETEKFWQGCLAHLQDTLPQQAFDTWIRPLQAKFKDNAWILFAPNDFVIETIKRQYFSLLQQFLGDTLSIQVGHASKEPDSAIETIKKRTSPEKIFDSHLNAFFTFENFVEGNSNHVARAAAVQVSVSHGQAYNPLFIYGGVGLGKTHLMQAVGNAMRQHNPLFRGLYLHSERFVNEMISALQTNTINAFKSSYRALDALFIDDIQFFAGKERSQEELFHIFNSLFETGKQMIFTCDRYPKEIDGMEERLKSRFGWGLTVAIDPPELETRVAILLNKSVQMKVVLSTEVAFFIAKRVKSNVRELEGALKRVIAGAHFTGREISCEVAKEALRDLIALQDRLITIENIQKTVADYYKIKISDMLSKRRSRAITRPRQIAMALSKELTNHSLPEIGEAFGGRDHTTVLHSCRVITELKESQNNMKEDFKILMHILST